MDSIDRPWSEAADRNKEPIFEVLKKIFASEAKIIEIASGTGQHADYMTTQMPGWVWQPTDCDPESVAALTTMHYEENRSNLLPPLPVDATNLDSWPDGEYDGLYCANMIHISPWETCLGLFEGAQKTVRIGGQVVIYGPFFEDGVDTAPSNISFDQSLRHRNSDWGIRQRHEVEAVAAGCGFKLIQRSPMPANNLTLVFTRQS